MLLLSTACLGHQTEPGVGTFTISFDGSSRAAYPPNIPAGTNPDPSAPTINDLRFEVSFTGIRGSGGETFSFIGNQELTSSVVVGTYNVTIRVFLRSDNSIYAHGAAINNPVTIVSGPNPNIIIDLAPGAQANITGRWAGSSDNTIGDTIVLTRGSNESDIVFDIRSNGTFRMTLTSYSNDPQPGLPGGSGPGSDPSSPPNWGYGEGAGGTTPSHSVTRSTVETETLDGTYSVSGSRVVFVVVFEGEREEFSGRIEGNTMYVDLPSGSGGDSGDPVVPGPQPIQIVSLTIRTEPTKLEYTVGERIDLTGLVVRVWYGDGLSDDITDTSMFEADPDVFLFAGEQTVRITYIDSPRDPSTTFGVRVTN